MQENTTPITDLPLSNQSKSYESLKSYETFNSLNEFIEKCNGKLEELMKKHPEVNSTSVSKFIDDLRVFNIPDNPNGFDIGNRYGSTKNKIVAPFFSWISNNVIVKGYDIEVLIADSTIRDTQNKDPLDVFKVETQTYQVRIQKTAYGSEPLPFDK